MPEKEYGPIEPGWLVGFNMIPVDESLILRTEEEMHSKMPGIYVPIGRAALREARERQKEEIAERTSEEERRRDPDAVL